MCGERLASLVVTAVASRLAISSFLYGKGTFEVVSSQLLSFLGLHVNDESPEDELDFASNPDLASVVWMGSPGSFFSHVFLI